MPENPRLLSSRTTLFYKYGVLGFFAIIWSLASFVVMSERAKSGLGASAFAFPILGVALFYIVYLIVGRALKVELIDGAFLVSSLSQSVSIPISEVESIGGSRFTNPERIWLDLRRPCPFGSTIHFLPPLRWFHFYSLHPLVEELKLLVEQTRSGEIGKTGSSI